MALHGSALRGADQLFTEMLFGSIGVAVIAATVMTLGSVASIPTTAPALEAGVAMWVDDASTHLVDISQFAAAEAATPEPQEAIVEDEDVVSDEADIEPVKLPEEPKRAQAPRKQSSSAPASDAVPYKSEKKQPSTKPNKGRRCTEKSDPAITAITSNSWTIDDAVIERYTRDWSRLGDLGWSQIHKGADGRSDGLQIGGIRCGSDPYDAGFRTGDIIHTINGRKIHNIPAAIMAYTALHNDRAFEIEITRRGERQTLTYRLEG